MKYYIRRNQENFQVFDEDNNMVFARSGFSTCENIIRDLQLGLRVSLPWSEVTERKENCHA